MGEVTNLWNRFIKEMEEYDAKMRELAQALRLLAVTLQGVAGASLEISKEAEEVAKNIRVYSKGREQ